jgi:hypothetical protein
VRRGECNSTDVVAIERGDKKRQDHELRVERVHLALVDELRDVDRVCLSHDASPIPPASASAPAILLQRLMLLLSRYLAMAVRRVPMARRSALR